MSGRVFLAEEAAAAGPGERGRRARAAPRPYARLRLRPRRQLQPGVHGGHEAAGVRRLRRRRRARPPTGRCPLMAGEPAEPTTSGRACKSFLEKRPPSFAPLGPARLSSRSAGWNGPVMPFTGFHGAGPASPHRRPPLRQEHQRLDQLGLGQVHAKAVMDAPAEGEHRCRAEVRVTSNRVGVGRTPSGSRLAAAVVSPTNVPARDHARRRSRRPRSAITGGPQDGRR